MYDIDHIKEREHDSHNDHSDDSTDPDDNDGLNHTGQSFDDRIRFLVVADSHFPEHLCQGPRLFSDLDGCRELYREAVDSPFERNFLFPYRFSPYPAFYVLSSERGRKRFPCLYFQEHGIDLGFVIPIIHTGPHN